MKRCIFLLFFASALTGLLAESPTSGHAPEGEGQFGDVDRWARVFDDPERVEWQKPGVVMRLLDVDAGQRVADIGAGTGYFTRLLAWGVEAFGTVYAVDVDAGMLEHLTRRDDLPDWDNIETILAEPNDPKLPEGELDQILIVNTWHHIDGRPAYIKRLARALDRGGRVMIIDWRKHELPMGPPPDHKLTRDEVVAEFTKAGWKLTSESVALPYQYVLVFHPPS